MDLADEVRLHTLETYQLVVELSALPDDNTAGKAQVSIKPGMPQPSPIWLHIHHLSSSQQCLHVTVSTKDACELTKAQDQPKYSLPYARTSWK